MTTVYFNENINRKISNDSFMYFVNNLKGNWVVKLTKYGNIKFCETDENGNIFHPNVFYTLYYDYTDGFYFRRSTPSGQYQLFRSYKYGDWTRTESGWYNNRKTEWKHFKNIEIATAYFNQYYEKCTTGSLKHWQWTHNSNLCWLVNGKLAEPIKLTSWKTKF